MEQEEHKLGEYGCFVGSSTDTLSVPINLNEAENLLAMLI
jgi:hypothetical protein